MTTHNEEHTCKAIENPISISIRSKFAGNVEFTACAFGTIATEGPRLVEKLRLEVTIHEAETE